MPERFTVSDLAGRLERANPKLPVSYYARQVRNWAQQGLLGRDVEISGEGRTAARLFGRHHLAMAKLFSVLTRLGFEANALRTTATCLLNLDVVDKVNVPKARPGIEYVIAYHSLQLNLHHYRPWFSILYATESGDIQSGSLTQNPSLNATAVDWMTNSNVPAAICLNVSQLLTGLFENDETFERRRADRERFDLSSLHETRKS